MREIERQRNEMEELVKVLREIGERRWAHRLSRFIDRTRRSPSHRKAPRQTRPMTPELAEKLRKYARRHKNMRQSDIADVHRVSHNAMSQAISGKI